jgi:LacI family transcriptional regulator
MERGTLLSCVHVPVSLTDVARHTGFSKATVSRVLSADPRISLPTSLKVREAMATLGYRPTERTRGVVKTGNVAFLIADPIGSVHEDLFFSEVLRGVAEQLEPHGYHALVSPSDGQLATTGHLPAVTQRVEGIIAGGVSLQASLVRALMQATAPPTVFIGRFLRGRGMNAVLPDNQEGGYLATTHLLDLGRRRIVFMGGPPDTNIYRDRLAGYNQALEEGDRATGQVIAVARTAQAGMDATLAMLDRLAVADLPDAIFAADDWIAIGVLRALRTRGLRVPDDLAVVGYSDIPLAPLADPPLTTVHVPKRRLGRTAGKLLLDVLNKEIDGPVQMVVSPSLVVRESTVGPKQEPV